MDTLPDAVAEADRSGRLAGYLGTLVSIDTRIVKLQFELLGCSVLSFIRARDIRKAIKELRALQTSIEKEIDHYELRCSEEQEPAYEPMQGRDPRKRVVKLLLLSNGLVAAFDDAGQQIPELQAIPLLDLVGTHAERCGFTIEDAQFQDTYQIFKRDNGRYFVGLRSR